MVHRHPELPWTIRFKRFLGTTHICNGTRQERDDWRRQNGYR